ncbi:MAG: hypothetical protein GY841_03815, partial [FCB group bacterium]|nr:hypothetical protein [FCB group bacterium]
MAVALRIEAIIAAVDRVTRPMSRMQQAVGRFTRRARRSMERIDRVTSRVARTIGKTLKIAILGVA